MACWYAYSKSVGVEFLQEELEIGIRFWTTLDPMKTDLGPSAQDSDSLVFVYGVEKRNDGIEQTSSETPWTNFVLFEPHFRIDVECTNTSHGSQIATVEENGLPQPGTGEEHLQLETSRYTT